MRRWRTVWEIRDASWGGNQCLLLLQQGWEPFAVTPGSEDGNRPPTVWFRVASDGRRELKMTGPEAGHVDAATVSVYEDAGGQWRWRARDTNGAIVADSGEAYLDHANAARAAADLFPDATLRDYDDAS